MSQILVKTDLTESSCITPGGINCLRFVVRVLQSFMRSRRTYPYASNGSEKASSLMRGQKTCGCITSVTQTRFMKILDRTKAVGLSFFWVDYRKGNSVYICDFPHPTSVNRSYIVRSCILSDGYTPNKLGRLLSHKST